MSRAAFPHEETQREVRHDDAAMMFRGQKLTSGWSHASTPEPAKADAAGRAGRFTAITSHLSRASVRLLAAESDEDRYHEAASCQHAMIRLLQRPLVQGIVLLVATFAVSFGGLLDFPAYQYTVAGNLIFMFTASKNVMIALILLTCVIALVNSIRLSPTELSHDLELFNSSWHAAAISASVGGSWLGLQPTKQVGLWKKMGVVALDGVQILAATIIMHARMSDLSLCMLPMNLYLYVFLPSFTGMLCCLSVSEVFHSRRSLLAQIEEARRLDLVENGAGAGTGAHGHPPAETWPEVAADEVNGERAAEKDL